MGTIDKAFILINQFSTEKPKISLAEMTKLTGLDKSTTRRLLLSLTKNDMLEQLPMGAGYQLGTLPHRLVRIRKKTSYFDQVAEKVLNDLVEAIGETAHVVRLIAGNPVHHLVVEPARATHVSFLSSEVVQLHATASGLCFLAHLPPNEIDQHLSKPLERCTEHTITDPDAIRDLLPEIQRTGIAKTLNTREDDVMSFATPFFVEDGIFDGTVAIAVPSNRVTAKATEAIHGALLAAGRSMTERLGGQLPA